MAAAGAIMPAVALAQDPVENGARAASLEDRILALDPTGALNGPKEAIANGEAMMAEAESTEISLHAQMLLHSYLAEGYYFDNGFEKALGLFEKALALAEQDGRGDSDDAEMLRDRISSTLSSLGRLDEALALQMEALKLKEARHGRVSDLYSAGLYSAALTHYRMGDIQGATGMIGEAWDLRKQLGPDEVEQPDPNIAIYGMSLAALHNLTGRQEEGLVAAREAAIWADANLGPENIVTPAALHNYGGLLNNVARFAEAEPVYRRVIEIRDGLIGREHPDMAISLNGLAFALQGLGRLEEAEALMLESSAIFAAHPDASAPQQAGIVMLNASNIAADLGHMDVAYERRRKALALLEGQVPDDHFAFAQVWWGIGQSELSQGNPAAAIEPLRKSTAIFAKDSESYEPMRVRATMTLAEALVGAGEAEEGMAVAGEAYAAARARLLDSPPAASDFIRTEQGYAKSFGIFAELAFETGDAAAGVEALQLARFGDLDRSSRALAVRSAADNEQGAQLVRSLQDAGEEMRRLREAESGALTEGDEAKLAEIQVQLATQDSQIGALEGQLDAIFPGFRELSRPHPVSLADIRAGLAEDEAVLFVHPDGSRILTAAVTADGVEWNLANGDPTEYYDAVRAMRRSVDFAFGEGLESFPLAQAHDFYRAVFSPEIERALAGRGKLNVLASGYAATIPFAMLPLRAESDGDEPLWLVERFALATPLSLEPLAPRATTRSGTIRMAGIGNPALADAPAAGSAPTMLAMLRSGSISAEDVRQLPSLPETESELDAIDAAIANPANLLLTGASATEQAIRRAPLADYDLLVFATHGLVSGELSGLREPALVLTPPAEADTPDATDNDGLLTASEIAGLQLDADWVILSACNTAAGDGRGSPQFSGLARAFVHAGARALMLSHWRVRDDAAARLSVDTVRGAAGGLDRAEALRRAQLALMRDASVEGAAHPAVWAPFVIVED